MVTFLSIKVLRIFTSKLSNFPGPHPSYLTSSLGLAYLPGSTFFTVRVQIFFSRDRVEFLSGFLSLFSHRESLIMDTFQNRGLLDTLTIDVITLNSHMRRMDPYPSPSLTPYFSVTFSPTSSDTLVPRQVVSVLNREKEGHTVPVVSLLNSWRRSVSSITVSGGK